MKYFRIVICINVLLLMSSIVRSQERSYPPPGELVDIGGYKLHLIVKGKNQSGPTVVFFHGAGDIALNWNLVLPQVGEFATAVSIDQAGEGWSDHSHGASLFQQVFDSHKALQIAGLSAPYVLVGQSLGGILANIFAKEFPNEIDGVVMVDATHPDVLLNVYNKETKNFEWKIFRLTASDSIPAVVKTPLVNRPKISTFQPRKDFGDMLEKFSEYDKKLFNWIYNERPWPYVKGYHDYSAEIFAEMHDQKAKYLLSDIPLVVLTGGAKEFPEDDKTWTADRMRNYSDSLQIDLLNLSSVSRHVIAKNSGHQIHIDEPEAVVEAVRRLVQRIKDSK